MKKLEKSSQLTFNKAVVTELRDSLMQQINGGSAFNEVVIQLTALLIK
ncbi:class I lanthipeptide [Flavobacterium amniphilum]|nr:class I lanthipeptide [Flavobacterium amniphilum]MCL9807412.1 class I lanthipeptide [Flavobacterium amniphilum]